MRRLIAALYLTTMPVHAAQSPRVVVDIAPVGALVAQVMEGVGTPDQIIPTGASPHGYAMRPSEARALGQADLVVWVGPALTHWLEDPLETLAPQATHLTLMQHAGTQNLPMRAAEELEAKGDHDHDAQGHDEDAHDKHDDHDDHAKHEDHEDHDDHDDHAHGAEKDHDDHGHDHGHVHSGTTDPHGWMSPANAVLWAGVVAQELARIDPANAATYMANWEALSVEVDKAAQDIAQQLEPYRDTSFIVLHDSFQYFEQTFGVEASAFVIPGDGQAPGPARVKALRDHLAGSPAVCAFTAPQENEDLLRTALEGQATRVAVLDPLGAGDVSYATLLRDFADAMAACFAGKS